MINAIIIDDEFHARQTIRKILELQFQNINICGEADSVSSAVKLIENSKPALIFLDIDLPDGTGFDILTKINFKQFKIIFITAHQEYAIQAIKFSAFDYILKPINPSELIHSVNNVLSEKFLPGSFEDKLDAFFTNFSHTTPEQKRIVLKTAEKIHVLDIKNIIRFESDNSYCTVYINSGDKIVVSKSIKSYEGMLISMGFLRVHQSHLINCNYINYYEKQYGGSLVMADNSKIPVSNQKKPILFAYLDSL